MSSGELLLGLLARQFRAVRCLASRQRHDLRRGSLGVSNFGQLDSPLLAHVSAGARKEHRYERHRRPIHL
jgi:hypothetical protein